MFIRQGTQNDLLSVTEEDDSENLIRSREKVSREELPATQHVRMTKCAGFGHSTLITTQFSEGAPWLTIGSIK